jgi:hypothetical protein
MAFTIHILGKIHPTSALITMGGRDFNGKLDSEGVRVAIKVRIDSNDYDAEITIEGDQLGPKEISAAAWLTHESISAPVNIVGFMSGIGYYVSLDEIVFPEAIALP